MADADRALDEDQAEPDVDDVTGEPAAEPREEPTPEEPAREEPDADETGRSRLDVVAGVVLLLYVLWVTAQLGVLLVSDDAYDAIQDAHAGPVARVALVVVLLAGLWHTVQGGLALLAGPLGRRLLPASRIRAVTWFVTLAAGIPGALVILWPTIAGIPT